MNGRFRLPGAAERSASNARSGIVPKATDESTRPTFTDPGQLRAQAILKLSNIAETLHPVNESFLKCRSGFHEYMSDGVAQEFINHI